VYLKSWALFRATFRDPARAFVLPFSKRTIFHPVALDGPVEVPGEYWTMLPTVCRLLAQGALPSWAGGELQVRFMVTKTEMGERYIYHHICKLYVDGKYLGTSPVVQQAEAWTTLFSKKVRAGKHEVQVVHGFVKDGGWDGEQPEQPRVFQVVVEPGHTTPIQYSFEVGWFTDQYRYEQPWRGLPR